MAPQILRYGRRARMRQTGATEKTAASSPTARLSEYIRNWTRSNGLPMRKKRAPIGFIDALFTSSEPNAKTESVVGLIRYDAGADVALGVGGDWPGVVADPGLQDAVVGLQVGHDRIAGPGTGERVRDFDREGDIRGG